MNSSFDTRGKNVVGIIPARIDSEEVHAKVLADLCGKPVIHHVYQRVAAANMLDQVIIAADHEQILTTAQSFGANTFLTHQQHVCGTDRSAETVRELFPDADIVVNVQADEPFLNPGMISQVVEPLLPENEWDMTTLCCRSEDETNRVSPFTVKVAKSTRSSQALYFSRAVIPYPRYPERATFFQHIGIYAYRLEQLERFAALGPSPLELTEGLEQLRALEAGMRIKVIETDLPYAKISIDTQQDVEKARLWLEQAQRGSQP